MGSLALEGGTVVTMDGQRRIIDNGSVVVEADRIVDVGDKLEVRSRRKLDEVIDCTGKVVIPGLINAHTHMFQNMLRGLGDDMELIGWLKNMLYPAAAVLTPDHVRVGARLGSIEMVKTGVTTVLDNHHVKTSETAVDHVAEACVKTGLRAFIARGMKRRTKRSQMWRVPDHIFEFELEEDVAITERLLRRWREKGNGLVEVSPGPTSIFSTGPELLKEAKRISRQYKVPMHIHIAESPSEVASSLEDYGMREVEFLDHIGVLDSRTHIVHGIWLSKGEIDLMGRTGAHHIHCPVSNMILASGVADVPRLLKGGVNVALNGWPGQQQQPRYVRSVEADRLTAESFNVDPHHHYKQPSTGVSNSRWGESFGS
jgi:5-methylthioadenosine/S-adenosylhomocysteine deaminase